MTEQILNLMQQIVNLLEDITGVLQEQMDSDIQAQDPLWQRFIRFERNRLSWLWEDWYIVLIALGLIVILLFFENWLIQGWQWLVLLVGLFWSILISHWVTSLGIGIILVYLFLGLQWLTLLDDFVRWGFGSIKNYPGRSSIVAVILLMVGSWIFINQSTDTVVPFTVGQIEIDSLNGEKVANQLMTELNMVGKGEPPPVLILWELREPRTSNGSVLTRRNLLLGECDTVLQGPGDFVASRRISLVRSEGDNIQEPNSGLGEVTSGGLAGSATSRVNLRSSRKPLDLGTVSFGGVGLSSQIPNEFLKILSSDYREFSGHITENKGEIEISVFLYNSPDNSPDTWSVTGPSDAFPEMIKYLALRIALDLNSQLIRSSELAQAPSEWELSFALGNDAFRQQHYRRAKAFFELANQFAPFNKDVEGMMALTDYHLASSQSSDDPARFDRALQGMSAAVAEDPLRRRSLLRPYLACLYYKAGQVEEAKHELATFNSYRRQSFDEQAQRLAQLPLRGPGRRLTVSDGNVIFVDKTGSITGTTNFVAPIMFLPIHQNPRQIKTYAGSNLLFVSQEGSVWIFTSRERDSEQSTPRSLIASDTLNSVQQISFSTGQFSRTNLFLLNFSGQVYWCNPDASKNSVQRCALSQRWLLDFNVNIKQIFAVEDRLYMLSDGAVWFTEVLNSDSEKFAPPENIASLDQVREIFVTNDQTVSGDLVYLLHENGNVWLYYDDNLPKTEDLELIDDGTNTTQIFAVGSDYLYLLKSEGGVWRISNPLNPELANFTQLEVVIPALLEGETIEEIFINRPKSEENPVLYLLTNQRKLLEGPDTGDEQITFTRIFTDLAETTPSQQ